MPKDVALPVLGQPKKFPLRLPDELAADLYAFCEATGAFHTKVICKAVRRYIDEELRANEGFRSDFAREKAKLVDQSLSQPSVAGVLRLMPSREEPNDKGTTAPTNRGRRSSRPQRKKKD